MKYVTCLCVFVLCFASSAFATTVPKLTGPVNDYAGVLSSGDSKALSDKLLSVEQQTSNQVVVLTIKTLNGQDIESYAHDVFHTWGLGKKKEVNKPGNNGVLFVIAVDDHKMRIEVGYGTEGTLTDATSFRIIHDDVTPLFKQSKFSDGINLGVNDIQKTITGGTLPNAAVAPAKKKGWTGTDVLAVILAIVLLLICAAINSPIGSGIFGAIGGFVIVFLLYTLGLGILGAIGGCLIGIVAGMLGLQGIGDIASSIGDNNSSSGGGSSGGSSYSGGGGDSGGGGASGSW